VPNNQLALDRDSGSYDAKLVSDQPGLARSCVIQRIITVSGKLFAACDDSLNGTRTTSSATAEKQRVSCAYLSRLILIFDTTRKRLCDFLFVRHGNLGPILRRF